MRPNFLFFVVSYYYLIKMNNHCQPSSLLSSACFLALLPPSLRLWLVHILEIGSQQCSLYPKSQYLLRQTLCYSLTRKL